MDRTEAIFHEALAIAEGTKRREFLLRACGGDVGLRERVERLLGLQPHAAGVFPTEPSVGSVGSRLCRWHEALVMNPSQTAWATGPNAAPTVPPIPRTFGDYELLEEIARGGMGVVYRARQVSLDRIVAIKLILTGPAASRAFIHRFRTEASAAANLQHPNIVGVHEVGTQQGENYLVMDYVDGPDLSRFVGREALGAHRAAGYLKAIAEAVHHAHERGILHRDLKPSNVLVDSTRDQPRVTDFGLARRLDGDSSLTITGQVIGSPSFMPPEQADGTRGPVGRHSDVYGLGGILYYLLTARAPFQGESLEQTLQATLNQDPIAPRLLNAAVPPDLETICLKCLEKEPDRRYRTARELADEVGRFLADTPIQARPVSPLERGWRWCRRKPALAGSLALALILLLIVAVGSPIATFHINRARTAMEREARRAEAGELAYRRRAYSADMNLAHVALQEQNLARAIQLLDRWIPSNIFARQSSPPRAASGVSTTQALVPPDLRGWEWRHLRALCRSDEITTLTPPARKHLDFIVAVAYSPDGRWLASASHDGHVKLFDRLLRQETAELRHGTAVRTVTFSPRHQTLATLGDDQMLRLWEMPDLRLLEAIPAQAGKYAGAAVFSRDGTWLAFSEVRDGWVTMTNFTTRESLALPAHSAPLTGLAFSPDAAVLATRAWDGFIKLWDVRTGRQQAQLAQSPWGTSTVAFSPDGRQLLSTSVDQTTMLWDTGSGRLLHTHRSRIAYPCAGFFLDDRGTIVLANADYTITFWDVSVAPWKERGTLIGHHGSVWALARSPDGAEIASGSTDGEVRLWGAAAPTPQIHSAPLPNDTDVLAIAPDARSILLLRNDRSRLELWDTGTLSRRAEARVPQPFGNAFVLHSDGKTIVSGGTDGTARLWRMEAESADEHRRYAFGSKEIHPLAFSLDGTTMALRQHPETILLVDVATGRCLLQFLHPKVTRGSFSPEGTHYVSLAEDGSIELWELAARRRVWTGAHERAVTDAAFFPDGSKLVTGAWQPQAKVWEVDTGRELASLEGMLLGANCVAVSPDGQRVAVGTGEGTIKMFMLSDGEPLEVMTLRCLANETAKVLFLPDGESLAAICRGKLQVWRAPLP